MAIHFVSNKVFSKSGLLGEVLFTRSPKVKSLRGRGHIKTPAGQSSSCTLRGTRRLPRLTWKPNRVPWYLAGAQQGRNDPEKKPSQWWCPFFRSPLGSFPPTGG